MTLEHNVDKKVRIFWDIDGTLIRTNGAAAIPFRKAVADYFGTEVSLDRKRLSGFTDYEIIRTLANDMNFQINKNDIERILNNYSRNLPNSLIDGQATPINNISTVLGELKNSLLFENAVATGNCKAGSLIKLQHTGLLEFFEEKNIFHSSLDFESRDEVLHKAKYSLLDNQVGIVVGDSPKDILSAKNNSMKIFAVATGMHNYEELLAYKPDQILEQIFDPAEFKSRLNDLITFP